MKNESLMQKLAIHGGPKTITSRFKRYNPIGPDEAAAAQRVIESGVLSQFLGSWSEHFLGGPKVREFERACEAYFKVKHAVTVNSATSALVAAVGAIGTEPGDEVIVSPWTMSASATAILQWNAIPVFADIDAETFNLDPASVEANITPHTRAIVAIDIFGHAAEMHALRAIAAKHKLKIISDTAQAPGALYHEKYAGTLADIGVYSLNYHKHIHTGEGGVLVTDDDEYAQRLRLIRNHAEAVVGDMGQANLANMLGYNFRLGEIECAMGIEQLKKLKGLVASRQRAAQRLTEGLKGLAGLRTPIVKPGCTHVFYVYPLVLDIKLLGVKRERIHSALVAEGLQGLAAGYTNLHLLPMYQKKVAYGSKGFPWTSAISRREVDYRRGICPVAEDLHANTYMSFLTCMHELSDQEVDLVIAAFRKVWAHMEALQA